MRNSPSSRDWPTALRAAVRWMANPVSEFGAANAFRFGLSLARPEIFALREAMRTSPTGRRMLEQRPDLGAALGDMEALSNLREGSLGREFHAFMSHPDTVPGYLLAGLAYEGGYFEGLAWDEEIKWMLDRAFNTHDLLHVLSGYGADLAGEGLNIFFSLGAMAPRLSFRGAVATPFGAMVTLLPPPIGFLRWWDYLREALERGRAVGRNQAFSCIAWEDLLPLPIESARREAGVPPLRDPGMRTADWGSTWIMRRIESGHGSTEQAKERFAAYRAVIEAGVPLRAFMRCSVDTRVRIGRRALEGTSLSELMAELGDGPLEDSRAG